MKRFFFFTILILSLLFCLGCNREDVKIRPSGETLNYEQDETMETVFFSLEILNIELARNFQEHIPESKKTKFLALEVSITNLSDKELPLTYGDFPLSLVDFETDQDHFLPLEAFLDEQLPDTFLLKSEENLIGLLIYEVPKEADEFQLIYEEIYQDDFIGNTHIFLIR
jgi:hypothetical protein